MLLKAAQCTITPQRPQATTCYLNNGSIFTLPNAKAMSGDRILSFDNMEITGWYHDGWYKWNTAANDGQGGF